MPIILLTHTFKDIKLKNRFFSMGYPPLALFSFSFFLFALKSWIPNQVVLSKSWIRCRMFNFIKSNPNSLFFTKYRVFRYLRKYKFCRRYVNSKLKVNHFSFKYYVQISKNNLNSNARSIWNQYSRLNKNTVFFLRFY